MRDEARTEEQLRDEIVRLVDRAYLAMTDRGEPGEEWPPGVLEELTAALALLGELMSRFGEDAVARLGAALEASGEMRAELLTAVIEYLETAP